MPIDKKLFTVGRRVQFKDTPQGFCAPWHLKFGHIINQRELDTENVLVRFDVAICGRTDHLCSMSYLHPILSPEDELKFIDQQNREKHADKYL